MNDETRDRDYRFLTGLMVGSVAGAGLALLLAPRAAAEIKSRAVDTAKGLGNAVSGRYQDARERVADAVDGLTRRGQHLRDGVADAVVRGAQDVERGAQEVQRFAAEAKSHKAG